MTVSFVAFLLLLRTFELDRSKVVLNNEINQRQHFFDQIKDLEGRQQQTLVSDYTFWDDMVDFVKTGSPSFAAQNIDTSLKTYGVDGAWVYRTDRKLVYGATVADSRLDAPQLPAGAFDQLKSKHFMHFFINSSAGVMEIRAATIHPSNDEAHKTPAQGYFLVGRLWKGEYLNQLGSLSQSGVAIVPATAEVEMIDPATGKIRFTEALLSWDGKSIAKVRVESKVPVVDDLNTLYQRQGLLLLIFGFTSLAIIIFAINRWVLRPMAQISSALAHDEPGMLTKLGRSTSEFGQLARTVMEFYHQKVNLAQAESSRKQLEDVNELKSDFLATAAHELTTPATNIGLLAELADKATTESKVRQYLMRIRSQARKINNRVNDLVDVSRAQREEISPRKQAFDVDKFINESVADMQITTEQKIAVSAKAGVSIQSDIDRLDQVLSNLIRNAAKYSPKDSVIQVSAVKEEGQVVISVTDNGIGISDLDRQKLFTRFFRAESVKKAKYSGLGLGLYLSAQIIHALGGKINVTSEAGKGSTFSIYLPL